MKKDILLLAVKIIMLYFFEDPNGIKVEICTEVTT